MKLSRARIKELESKYGKHKFCYQCGNPEIIPVEDWQIYKDKYYECPKCGSSDLDK